MNIIKLMKSIPKLAKANLNTQAASLINVSKASFDIPQSYKDHVIALPPHFVELMFDIYRDSAFDACESGLKGLKKEDVLNALEEVLKERASKVIEVMSETEGLYNSFKDAMSAHFDEGFKEAISEPEVSTLEQSIEEKIFNDAIVEEKPVVIEVKAESQNGLTSDVINNMIAYVNKLNENDKTALIYALGISEYVDPSTMKGVVTRKTTASIEEGAMLKEDDMVPVEQEKTMEDHLSKTTEVKICNYDISKLKEKVESIVKSHKFPDGANSDLVVIDTVIEDVEDMNIEEVCKCILDKLDISCESSIESLYEGLDHSADLLNTAIDLPVSLFFLKCNGNLCLCAEITKSEVASMMETYTADANTKASASEIGFALDFLELAKKDCKDKEVCKNVVKAINILENLM